MVARVLAAAAAAMLAVVPLAAQQPQPARPAAGVAVSGIGKLAFAERPQRSRDQEQETLALQFVESLGLGCRGHEMYRWTFAEDDPDRAQQIVAAGSMVPIIEANFQRGMRMMVFSTPEEGFAWLAQFED